jgi:hypothetical protein
MNQTRIQEDLSIIKRIMEESRQNFYNYGINLVVWGGLVIAALMLTYINVAVYYLIPEYWYWIISFGSGFVFEFIYGRKWKDHHKAIQPANRIGSTLWMSILFTMVLFGSVGVASGAIRPENASGLIAGLLAIGYQVTGEAIKLPWVKRLGYGWWVGSVVLFFLSAKFNILLMALLMLFLQFIPGIILLVKGPKND